MSDNGIDEFHCQPQHCLKRFKGWPGQFYPLHGHSFNAMVWKHGKYEGLISLLFRLPGPSFGSFGETINIKKI